MKKRILALMLMLSMAFCLAGCAGGEKESTSEGDAKEEKQRMNQVSQNKA